MRDVVGVMLAAATLLSCARAVQRVTGLPLVVAMAALAAVGWQPSRLPGGADPSSGLGEAEQATQALNAAYRAAYVVKSGYRIRQAISNGKSLDEAVAAEKRIYQQHAGAEQKRTLNAQRVDRAAGTYGELLGWHAVVDRRTDPQCKAANGNNFEVGFPPVIGYPGSVHPNCRCVPGPPFPRGKRLASGSLR